MGRGAGSAKRCGAAPGELAAAMAAPTPLRTTAGRVDVLGRKEGVHDAVFVRDERYGTRDLRPVLGRREHDAFFAPYRGCGGRRVDHVADGLPGGRAPRRRGTEAMTRISEPASGSGGRRRIGGFGAAAATTALPELLANSAGNSAGGGEEMLRGPPPSRAAGRAAGAPIPAGAAGLAAPVEGAAISEPTRGCGGGAPWRRRPSRRRRRRGDGFARVYGARAVAARDSDAAPAYPCAAGGALRNKRRRRAGWKSSMPVQLPRRTLRAAPTPAPQRSTWRRSPGKSFTLASGRV